MSRSKYPSEAAERFQIRLPEGMRDKIKESAEKNSRSMNAEIIWRLEESYREERSVEINYLLLEVKAHLAATKPMFEELGKRLGIRSGA